MTTFLNTVDRAALALTGLGAFGLAFAGMGLVDGTTGAVAGCALATGVATNVVIKLATRSEAKQADGGMFEFDPHADKLRLRNTLSDPNDPNLPGSAAWNLAHLTNTPQP